MTVDEFYRLETDLDGIYELDAGFVEFRPPPFVGVAEVQGNVACCLRNFVKPRGLGRVGLRSGVLVRRDPDTVFMPAVQYYSAVRMPLDAIVKTYNDRPPDLAVEVLSPDDRPSKIRRKVTEYLAAGVRMVWIVDPEDRTVTIHTEPNASRTVTEADKFDGGDVLPGFNVDVRSFFE